MSNNPIIRRAELRDIPQVAVLFDLYRQFYKLPTDIPRAERFLSDRIEKNESEVIVAEEPGGALLGFTQLYPTFTSLGMARSWVLNDLYVVEEARRTGVGRLLMNAAEDLARASGARSINLETQNENTRAQSLYESVGYQQETEFRFYSKALT